jgi:hypothetical protein
MSHIQTFFTFGCASIVAVATYATWLRLTTAKDVKDS